MLVNFTPCQNIVWFCSLYWCKEDYWYFLYHAVKTIPIGFWVWTSHHKHNQSIASQFFLCTLLKHAIFFFLPNNNTIRHWKQIFYKYSAEFKSKFCFSVLFLQLLTQYLTYSPPGIPALIALNLTSSIKKLAIASLV